MTVRILQLTDLHLFADPRAELRDIHTRGLVERVLAAVKPRAPEWDLIVLTGDLAHDEVRETYIGLRELLDRDLPGPRSRLRLVPGNHDNRAAMREIFPESEITPGDWVTFSTDVGGWRLIGLDTHCPGELWGRIEPSQRDWFRTQLAAHREQPTLVFMHHPPFAIQSRWLDKVMLQDADPFWEVVRSFSQIRAISCGHVHQEFTAEVHGVAVCTTPSCSIQFRPGTDELEIATDAPGFRVFELDGSHYQSQVHRS